MRRADRLFHIIQLIRGRRLGRPVDEELPVPLPASDLVLASGRLLDRNGDIYTAMATSFLAVTRNISAMIIWAALIVILSAIGFATLLFGMIVIFPILGHATWHAYRDLTQWE